MIPTLYTKRFTFGNSEPQGKGPGFLVHIAYMYICIHYGYIYIHIYLYVCIYIYVPYGPVNICMVPLLQFSSSSRMRYCRGLNIGTATILPLVSYTSNL